MPRIFAVSLALVLAGCASPQVVSQTPAGIEINCGRGVTCSSSPQEVADMAQRHCRQYGQNAQQGDMSSSPSGRQWASYRCVPAAR